MSDEEQTYGHPRVQCFYAYWRSRCVDGRLPGRRDIDPLEIPELLPGIVLMDVARDGQRLRFHIRLAGTMVCNVHRRDITGEWVEDVIGKEAGRDVTRNHITVVETRQPHFWRNHLHMEGRKHIEYQRLFCPLASDGETVDMLIGYFAFAEPAVALMGRMQRFRSTPRWSR